MAPPAAQPDSGNPSAPADSYESPVNVCQQWVDNLHQSADALAEIAASFTGSTRSA
ncbi:MAG: hypothetical protein ACRDRP_19185 [Pseudonocardiaceae bacterium]